MDLNGNQVENPIDIVIKAGDLKAGPCDKLGYTKPVGKLDQPAG